MLKKSLANHEVVTIEHKEKPVNWKTYKERVGSRTKVADPKALMGFRGTAQDEALLRA